MGEKGLSSVSDVLIFALLVSMSMLLLIEFTPVNPETKNKIYASSLARSTLLVIQNATVEVVGGVGYELSGLGHLSIAGGETRRTLKRKTFAELMSETVFLNLRVVASDGKKSRVAHEFDENLRGGLKLLLDHTFGGRFGYRLRTRIARPEVNLAQHWFEIIIENLNDAGRALCSETLILPLPTFGEQSLGNIHDGEMFESSVCPALEVTLGVWSR
jgi:hypothetical protein